MQEEVAKGWKLAKGPFPFPPFTKLKCSPVSLIPKRDSTQSQLIHNLSHPFSGRSVNALVSPEEAVDQYQKF